MLLCLIFPGVFTVILIYGLLINSDTRNKEEENSKKGNINSSELAL